MVKNLPANSGDVRDTGSIPGSERSPGGGHSNSLQYSCLENPMHRGTWQATVHEVTKSHTQPKQLSKHKQKMQPKDAGPCRPGLARWHHSREPTYRCKINRRWLDLWIGKILWSRKWQPTPVFLPGESPWTEEPGGLQSMGSQRVGHFETT